MSRGADPGIGTPNRFRLDAYHVWELTMRMMNLLAPLGVPVLLAATLSGCAKDADEPKCREIPGRVTAIDAETGKVSMSFFNSKHNRTDTLTGRLANDAEILIDGATATLADVEVGDRVTVTGRIEKHAGEPQLVATRVEVNRQALAPSDTTTRPADTQPPATGEGPIATPLKPDR